MQGKTKIKLVIGTVAFLGASYALQTHIKTKKRKENIKNKSLQHVTEDNINTRTYFPIAEVVIDKDNVKIKKC